MKFKTFILSILILKCSLLHADELKIYVIKPRIKINWSSPATLGITSALNSIRKDYAPIGHFAVELNCSQTLSNGVSKVLTGMERVSKKESKRITLKEKLGLGSLFYPFRGALTTAKLSKWEIEKAKKQKRLRTIIIPVSKVDCHRGLLFVEKWIQHGSYNIYGGGRDTLHGEGGGCAHFMSSVFKVVTGKLPPKEWSVHIDVPKDLIGDGDKKRVPFTKILTRFRWVKKGVETVPYDIADTNTVHKWLKKRVKREKIYYYSDHLPDFDRENSTIEMIKEAAEVSELSRPLEPFLYQQPTSPEKEAQVWESIILK